MKSFAHKRSRKPPVSPDKEKPFFSPTTVHQPFFSATKSAVAQPKLTISKPNDPFEQEADAMAKAVMNQDHGQPKATNNAENQVHRISMMEEEEAQTKPELMRMEEEEAQTKPELMRMEEEEAQTKPELMRSATDSAQTKTSTGTPTKPSQRQVKKKPKESLTQRLKQTKGMGHPLPAQTQKQMAQAFKYDFSDVKIHTGDDAVQMTRELKAQAFTHGQDIYFNEGKYTPETSSGKELLAHELTHVVQQNQTS